MLNKGISINSSLSFSGAQWSSGAGFFPIGTINIKNNRKSIKWKTKKRDREKKSEREGMKERERQRERDRD